MFMGIEIDDDESFLIAEDRHRELVGVLNKVLSELSKDSKSDDKEVNAINKLSGKIEQFATAILTQEKSEKEVVNVNVDQKLIVSSLAAMSKEIITGLEDLKSLMQSQVAPKVWEFEIKRNSFSQFIDSVKATQK